MSALPYATVAAVKVRLGLTSTNRDSFLASLCDQANELVESITHRAIGSSTVTSAVYHGWDALEEGRCLILKDGIRSVTSVEVAPFTGAAFVTVPTTDYFTLPDASQRQPGWPAFELWMTDIPSPANTYPYFPGGFNNVRVSYTAGWDAMPNELRAAAERTVVRAYQGRAAGIGDGAGEDALVTDIGHFLAYPDRRVIEHYAWKPVSIVGVTR